MKETLKIRLAELVDALRRASERRLQLGRRLLELGSLFPQLSSQAELSEWRSEYNIVCQEIDRITESCSQLDQQIHAILVIIDKPDSEPL